MATVAAAAVILVLSMLTVYSSDDYGYALFFENGLLGYPALAVEHYCNVNGRALVHVFAHVILALGQWAFVLTCLASFLLMPWLCLRTAELDREERSLGRCLFLLATLVMPPHILSEGVMWQSAFCNYVLPSVMICWLLMLLRSGSRGWAVALSLLCGATTEQMGAVTVVVILLNAMTELRSRKLRPLWTLAELGCAAVGYLTIFLSPSTQARLLRETSLEEAAGLLESLRSGLLAQVGRLNDTPAVAVLVTVTLLAAALLLRKWSGWLPAVLGTAGVWFGVLGPWQDHVLPWAVVYGILVIMAAVLLWNRHEVEGTLLMTAMASLIVMIPTQSNRDRCLLPMYLFLSIAAALLTVRAAKAVPGRVKNGVLCILTVCSLICCVPVLRGYWFNYQVERINAAHAAQWEPGEVLPYCMDYDMDYTYSKPYTFGGAYERDYLRTRDLDPDQVTLAYYASGAPTVYVNERQVRFPAMEHEGLRMLPLRTIVETAGGTVELQNDEIRVVLGDRSYSVAYIYGGPAPVKWSDGETTCICMNGIAGFYLEERFFTELLQMELTDEGMVLRLTAEAVG